MSQENDPFLTLLDPYSSDEPFPPVEMAWNEPNGLLAMGGDLSSERLINAYRSGIFPWFSPEEPIYWWSPDPRAVLYPHKINFRRSLRKTMRNKGYRITFDHSFAEVVHACAAPRSYTDGTWITQEMYHAYIALHKLNIAHSVEVWNSENKLVGGLYGVDTGGVFSGESMFSIERDTSKMAFIALAKLTQQRGHTLIDCQIENPHLISMGAENIPRQHYIKVLNTTASISVNTVPVDNWKMEIDCAELSQWQPEANFNT
ncbi:MAG TPA: leucyl/phenylalanyl-tRNA--protein transferase [Leucothrix mucor]|uniref:Leucyl/phenylalanyl-tRNA--protein transferase n=1 Tax=Leucothrix mucor TaxID=45248 RepID=A0A7V2WVV6_LEUMU|nr:leucyl/phenylalanyl-tRNA--protein transferase [Leucothrix mucor]